MPARRRRPTTAFVLSGGASLGAIQVGMLRALYERGITPDLIVGTSVGALNAAFVASRPPTVGTADALGEVWRGLRRGRLFPVDPLTGLLGLAGARDHLVPGRALRGVVSRHLEFDRLEDAPVPLHVIATDVLTGEEVRLSRGPALDAVMASAAIPGVLPTVDWDGRVLMDGGVSNNAPLSHAVDLGARRVYVLPSGHACDLAEPPRSAIAMLVHATSLLVQRHLDADLARLGGLAEVVVLPPPCPLAVQPFDFGHAELLIRRALADARAFLDARRRDARPRTGERGASAAAPRPRPAPLPDQRLRRLHAGDPVAAHPIGGVGA
jgi:NTE family protein